MMNLEITTGPYIIKPVGNRPDGRVFIEIMKVEGQDAHDHPFGPVRLIDVDLAFVINGGEVGK